MTRIAAKDKGLSPRVSGTCFPTKLCSDLWGKPNTAGWKHPVLREMDCTTPHIYFECVHQIGKELEAKDLNLANSSCILHIAIQYGS